MDRFYLRMLEFTRDGIYRYTVDGGELLFANQGFVDILELGRRPENIVGERIRDLLIYTEQEGMVRKALQANGEIHGFEYHFKTLSGKDKWVLHDSFLATEEESGRPLVHAIIKDITPRKLAEAALRDSEERFREVFQNAVIGMFRTTPDGRVLLANPALVRMLGYESVDQLSQLDLEEKAHKANYPRDGFKQRIERDGKVIGLESTWVRRDGTLLHVRESARVVRDRQGDVVYYEGTVEDITTRKQAEAQLEARTQELEDRNAELDSFVHTVSHDLKSPLVAIAGFAQLLEKTCSDAVGPMGQRYLQKITSNVFRMKEHIDDLLEISRVGREEAPVADVPLNEAIDDVLLELRDEIRRRGVAVTVAPDLPVVRYPRVRIRQVLSNLLENAVKFMGDQPEPRVEISAKQDDHELCILVRDNGMGMPPENLDRVFEVFLRLPQAATIPGTGVGLALVRRIAGLHGGRAWAESTLGEGSAFHFTIPAASVVGGKEARDG